MNRNLLVATLIALSTLTNACAVRTSSPQELDRVRDDVSETVARFNKHRPETKRYFTQSYGHAVFPTVGKGATIVGGAYGRGAVYEQGQLVGTTTLTQVTVGPQLGGQAYSEVIFFEDRAALDRFKQGNLEVGVRASAVAAIAGAAADAPYAEGIAIFTLTRGGLMCEASVGGQKFSFAPLVSER